MHLKSRLNEAKKEFYAVYYAFRHPGLPWYIKAYLGLIVAYAFSPIDLIPDFIPVIGYLDDAIILPLGIMLAVRMIPEDIMQACRDKASHSLEAQCYRSKAGALGILALWLVCLSLVGYIVISHTYRLIDYLG